MFHNDNNILYVITIFCRTIILFYETIKCDHNILRIVFIIVFVIFYI